MSGSTVNATTESQVVAMNRLNADPEDLVREQVAACERVIRSGWWILGQEVQAFEKEWAAWSGADHAIGCANGLDAIEIALRALHIGEGDEVITTSMTAFATTLAILRAGAVPVFADIDPDTAMIDAASVERCLTARTKAVVLVHLYGQGGDAAELVELAARRNFTLIEDCAQAHGAKISGRPVGSFGAVAAWSFYPTKNLGAVGDAGALTTASDAIATSARMLRNYGQEVRYVHPVEGMNSRLDEMQAAILRCRLPHLNGWIESRRKIAVRYAAGISNSLARLMPLPIDADRHVHHLVVLLTEQRDALQSHLRGQGVESLIHYPVPVHWQKPCAGLPQDPEGLGHTERHAAQCLSIPCHPAMTTVEIDRVIAAVNTFRA